MLFLFYKYKKFNAFAVSFSFLLQNIDLLNFLVLLSIGFTQNAVTIGATTLSTTTFSIMTLSINGLLTTFSIKTTSIAKVFL
jgi:hypothetical protein